MQGNDDSDVTCLAKTEEMRMIPSSQHHVAADCRSGSRNKRSTKSVNNGARVSDRLEQRIESTPQEDQVTRFKLSSSCLGAGDYKLTIPGRTVEGATRSKSDIMAPVWKIIEKGMDHGTDDATKDEIRQIYSSAAELYHRYRPRYPESIIDDAIQQSPLLLRKKERATILEIGCGPGTITLPLGSRGYQITAFDPGLGMIKKAKEVCQDLPNVSFVALPFKSFESEKKYDAIVAATSLHWAFTEGDIPSMVKKVESLLEDDGTLVLLWNYPAMPSSRALLDKIADALGEPKPFCFGVESIDALHSRMEQHVHEPLLDSGLFRPYTTKEIQLFEKTPVADFIYLMQTTSMYITMEAAEKKRVLAIVEEIARQESGDFIDTTRKLILNVTTKCK